jgi:hypothetical protein
MDHLKHFWLAAIIGWISSYSSIWEFCLT